MRTTDIDADWVLNYQTMPIARLPESEFDKHVLKDGDILVSRSGTCGVTVLFEQSKSSHPVIAGAFLIRFRLNRQQVLPEFLLAAFKGRSVQRALMFLVAGGVQKNLSGTNIKKVNVPLPPMREQQRIVATLGDTDDTRRKQITTLKRLKQLKAGLLQDLLTGKIRVSA